MIKNQKKSTNHSANRIGLVLIFYTKKTPYSDAFYQIIFGCPRNKLEFVIRLLSPRFELERFLVRLSGLV